MSDNKHGACMGKKTRKTITIDLDVYRRIRRHREATETLSATMRRVIPGRTVAEVAASLDEWQAKWAVPEKRRARR